MTRKDRLLMTVFGLVMGFSSVGLAIEFILKFRSGTSFQRYKNWQGLWVSYGDMTVFLVVAFVAAAVGLVWSWVARRREERTLIETYERKKGERRTGRNA